MFYIKMGLEDKVKEVTPKKVERRVLGVDPSMKYEKNSDGFDPAFVQKMGDLMDLEEYYAKLAQNTADVGALNDLIGVAKKYIPGDPQQIAAALMDPNIALEQADALLSEAHYNTARYVEANRDDILKRLPAEQLYAVFSTATLFQTGKRDHDFVLDLRRRLTKIQETAKKGGDIGSVVKKELKRVMEHLPPEQREFYLADQKSRMPLLIGSIVSGMEKAYAALFRDPTTGEPDRDALKKFLEDNYKVVEDAIAGVDEDGKELEDKRKLTPKEQFKRWDKNLKMQYFEIAKILFEIEKPLYKWETNEDEEVRKRAAKEQGMRT